MEVQVNYLAVFLAVLSSFAVGFVWYSKPVFGTAWMKLVNINEKKAAANMSKAMLKTTVASLVLAYVLAHVTYLSYDFFGTSFLSAALSTAFWLWLGVAAATIVTHDSFENRPLQLTAMNI